MSRRPRKGVPKTLGQLVPSLPAEFMARFGGVLVPGDDARRTLRVCAALNEIFGEVQRSLDGRAKFHAIVSDIAAACHGQASISADPLVKLRWWYLKFFVTIYPAKLAAVQRRFHDAYDWLGVGLDDTLPTIPPSGLNRADVDTARLLLFITFDIVPAEFLFEDLALWASALLYTSRGSAAFYEVIPKIIPLFQQILRGPLHHGTRIELCIELAEWLLDHGQLHGLVEQLVKIAVSDAKGLSEEHHDDRAFFALAMQGRLGVIAGAERETYAAALRAHPSASIRLQVAAEDLLRGLPDSLQRLLESMIDRNADSEPNDMLDSQLHSAQLLRAILPAVLTLARAGRHRDLLQVLATWRHQKIVQDLDESVVVWIPNTEFGSLLVSSSGSSVNPRVDIERLVHTFNVFRNGKIIVRGSLQPLPVEAEQRHEIVDGQGDESYASVVREMVLKGLQSSFAPLQSLFVLPFEPHPFQAILGERDTSVPPWTTSLRSARPDRRIRRAALVGTDATSAGIELPWLQELLGRHGVDTVLISPDEASVAAIRGLYEDPSFDTVWLAGHGEFNGRTPTATKLPLEGSGALSLSEIYSWRLPKADRRLLVLNVCYGGMAPLLGGMGELGFGTRLAGPNQAVISHLWNANWLLAPIFGVVLAGALLETEDYRDGFARALRVLRGGRESLHQELRRLDLQNAADRCERLNLDLESIAHWGSPAFMQ